MRTQRSVTMTQVAAQAGVSVQTVSNVLNAPEIVRPETAARVREVIEELAYRPNRAARQLRTKQSGLIGVRVESASSDGVFDRFLHAVTNAAADRGYRVLLYTAGDDDAEMRSYDDLLDRWNLDGFVLSHTHETDSRAAQLQARGVPCVSFGRPWEHDAAQPWVDVDGSAGTRKATEHLIAQGHSTIGFLGWPTHSRVGNDRHAGYLRAMAGAGLEPPAPGRCVNTVADARSAAQKLLTRTAATALVCVSDFVAIGALAASQHMAVVGRPLAPVEIIGFDNTDLAAGAGISSVAQPLVAVAEHCLRLLAARIEHPVGSGPVEQLLLVPDLVVRAHPSPSGHLGRTRPGSRRTPAHPKTE